ncbi:MAG: CDP-alcohol phosphatidyltransferase family protein [Vicinamibacteria bacterium]|nr:CDP-alcohol phosphatidyltransferase family protein [Vicinamibacteria bacterium]
MNSAIAATSQPTLSTRELRSLTADFEKKVLVGLARRLPAWIGPDHLTALGGLSMAGAGVCYRLVAFSPLALLGVNLFLFLNWFGDSLDGTVARVRQKQRPRYGFYVDHLVDAFGAIFLLGGLAGSGLASPNASLGLLAAYLLLQIHIALKAHTTRVFQIAFGGVGGTETRLLLAVLNLGLWAWPGAQAMVTPLVWLAAAGLVGLVVADGVRTGRGLDREERLLWGEEQRPSPIAPC